MPSQRQVSALADGELLASLRAFGVESAWAPCHRLECVLRVAVGGEDLNAVARQSRHRASTITRWSDSYTRQGRAAFFPPAGDNRKRATLAGLLAGRLVEEVALLRTRAILEPRLAVRDVRDRDPDPGWDFEVADAQGAAGAFTVDVKVHAEPFRHAERYTGLLPEDCVPLGLYKLLVARQRQQRGASPHLYCFAFRPGLPDELGRVLSKTLTSDEASALDLLFTTWAPGLARQQRRAVASIIDRHLDELAPTLDGYELRAISTHRATNLFLRLVDVRAPHLSGRGRGLGGTINMHYSWQDEMTSWHAVLQKANSDIASLATSELQQGFI